MSDSLGLISPSWSAPEWIKAYTTTQDYSQQTGVMQLPAEPLWLRQVHGTDMVASDDYQKGCKADGSYSKSSDKVCVVLTADCLPLLLTNHQGSFVAAIHGGWRGLAKGIIAKALENVSIAHDPILCWLGPAIGPKAFEVGEEVVDCFNWMGAKVAKAFLPIGQGKYLADLYQIATLQLHDLGVSEIYGGEYCTFNDARRFYSYRRDKTPKRMASMIWIAKK